MKRSAACGTRAKRNGGRKRRRRNAPAAIDGARRRTTARHALPDPGPPIPERTLPNELLVYVMSCLTAAERAPVRSVCRRWDAAIAYVDERRYAVVPPPAPITEPRTAAAEPDVCVHSILAGSRGGVRLAGSRLTAFAALLRVSLAQNRETLPLRMADAFSGLRWDYMDSPDQVRSYTTARIRCRPDEIVASGDGPHGGAIVPVRDLVHRLRGIARSGFVSLACVDGALVCGVGRNGEDAAPDRRGFPYRGFVLASSGTPEPGPALRRIGHTHRFSASAVALRATVGGSAARALALSPSAVVRLAVVNDARRGGSGFRLLVAADPSDSDPVSWTAVCSDGGRCDPAARGRAHAREAAETSVGRTPGMDGRDTEDERTDDQNEGDRRGEDAPCANAAESGNDDDADVPRDRGEKKEFEAAFPATHLRDFLIGVPQHALLHLHIGEGLPLLLRWDGVVCRASRGGGGGSGNDGPHRDAAIARAARERQPRLPLRLRFYVSAEVGMPEDDRAHDGEAAVA